MKRAYMTAVFASIGLLVLILDSKTAISGVSEGITMCIETVIPSLFSFFILSILLTNALSGRRFTILTPICRLLHIPDGAESILVTGLLGGYPIGAKMVADAVQNGYISRENGKRMLAFCSNAGPAFLFGIGSNIFPHIGVCWILWAIHIVSALIIGLMLPCRSTDTALLPSAGNLSLHEALIKSMDALAVVCGWVVLFRVILKFAERWFLWCFPKWLQCVFIGLTEMANGCCSLVMLEDIRLRFLLFAVFLSFGGICVCMQTFTICHNMDSSLYLPGKVLQGILSCALALMIISREIVHILIGIAAMVTVCAVLYLSRKITENTLAFSMKRLYTKEK